MKDSLRAQLLLALSILLLSCTNDDILLELGTLPGEVIQVAVDATVDGRPLQSLLISERLPTVILHLPDGVQGQLAVTVAGIGVNGCKIAAAQASVDYRLGSWQPTSLAVTLAPLVPNLCPVTVRRSGVAGRVVSVPPGLDCAKDVCVADFPLGQPVALTPAALNPGAYVRAAWMGACTGFSACTVTPTGPVIVAATLDMNYCPHQECWKAVPPAPSEPVRRLWGSSPDNIWAITQNLVYHYDGKTWAIPAKPPKSMEMNAISGSSAQDVWIVGATSIQHFDGSSWSQSSAAFSNLYGIWTSSAQEAWAVGDKGLIVHYTPGTGWTKRVEDQISTQDLRAIWGSSASDVWAIGTQLLHYDGAAWSIHPDSKKYFPSGYPLTASIWGSSQSDVWVAHVLLGFALGLPYYIASGVLHYDGKAWTDDPRATKSCGIPDRLVGTGRDSVFLITKNQLCHFDGVSWNQDGVSAANLLGIVDLWGSGLTGLWAAGTSFYQFLPE